MKITYDGAKRDEFGVSDNVRGVCIVASISEGGKMDKLYGLLNEKGYNMFYLQEDGILSLSMDVRDREEYEDFKELYKELKKLL